MSDKVVPIVRQSGSNCPNGQILLDNWDSCWTIRTTLLDNWNHLVIQMKTLAGETSSCLGGKVESQESRVKSQVSRVKSQESKFKIRVRDDPQKSKVKKEIQHRNETSSQSSSYLNHPSNNCHVTTNMPQVTYVFAILIIWLRDSVSPIYRNYCSPPTATPHLTFLISVCIAELRVSVYSILIFRWSYYSYLLYNMV